ncbi:hypothetical protein TUM22923_04570 [Polynucleobacter sp. TUM22923]|jgi:hypothetical protein|uniref:DUF2946 domain-containing protein n=1 Tax=Polynucleobacter sp. TUM22923 TaxID=3022126 RepID=UPI002573342A|nr:DUF2946 domain-containing protein [Polynucleobacter sp. TUM22923]BDX21136.1 hypothetical protein TUM22923_04570 [Polynucleobacter sp. TUM22923]
MNFPKHRLLHWLAALAVMMSALAPAISQAVSVSKHGQGFAMEICSAEGNQMQIEIKANADSPADIQDASRPCPYCFVQGTVTPALNTSLTFQAPQSFAFLPQLFYQSPQPLTVWLTPPSAAPPSQV